MISGPGAWAHPNDNERLQRAWGDLANDLHEISPWEWFATMTFRNDRTAPEAAHKTWRLWSHKLNREVHGIRYTKRGTGCQWLRGTESHRNRRVSHYHGLVGGGVADLDRFSWMEKWNDLAGYARIFPFEPGKGAEYYIAKYVAKGGEIDFWLPTQLALVVDDRHQRKTVA